MSSGQPNKRNALYFQNMAQHSSKIYEFFGVTPGFTPGQTPPISRIFNINVNATPPDVTTPPDTATAAGFIDGRVATTSDGHVPNGRPINGVVKEPALPAPPVTLRRSAFRALVQDFNPLWFTIPLNTTILSLLFRLLPSHFNFPGRSTISLVLITLALVLFAITSFLFLLRLVWFRRSAYDEISSSAGDDILPLATGEVPRGGMYGASGTGFLFLPCWPAVWLGIVAFAALDGAEAQIGNRPTSFVRFAYVGWWVGVVWTVLVFFTMLGWILSSPRAGRRTPGGQLSKIMALVVMTSVLAMVGWVGGLLGLELGGGEVISVQLLGPVVVFSFCAIGAAVVLAFFGFAVLMHELVLVTGWPPPEQTSNMFFLVGPMGQGAAASLYLGAAVERCVDIAGDRNRGSVPSPRAAQSVHVVCILLALFLVSMAVVWLVLSFMAVLFRLSRRELQWNPTLNGTVFPVASLGFAMAQLSDVLQSRFLGVLDCVLLVLSSVFFIVHLLLTFVHIFQGRLLIIREDRRLIASLD
ncbi:voltage-dependent anion channel-domain-containing protein [Immersiella caudata]|uniref:Voltage-dependent anion channel-domain-containing protein n=1 Tax=Immersiella caudata TaxID=314043 RepID=A0AA40BZF5_9PEZI|nr:voltage-dependent anion channel-domain-containing protein [Immersiella caudata]